jgi:hypothetical protein
VVVTPNMSQYGVNVAPYPLGGVPQPAGMLDLSGFGAGAAALAQAQAQAQAQEKTLGAGGSFHGRGSAAAQHRSRHAAHHSTMVGFQPQGAPPPPTGGQLNWGALTPTAPVSTAQLSLSELANQVCLRCHRVRSPVSHHLSRHQMGHQMLDGNLGTDVQSMQLMVPAIQLLIPQMTDSNLLSSVGNQLGSIAPHIRSAALRRVSQLGGAVGGCVVANLHASLVPARLTRCAISSRPVYPQYGAPMYGGFAPVQQHPLDPRSGRLHNTLPLPAQSGQPPAVVHQTTTVDVEEGGASSPLDPNAPGGRRLQRRTPEDASPVEPAVPDWVRLGMTEDAFYAMMFEGPAGGLQSVSAHTRTMVARMGCNSIELSPGRTSALGDDDTARDAIERNRIRTRHVMCIRRHQPTWRRSQQGH